MNYSDNIDWSKVGIENEADIIFITVKKYKFFFAEKKSGGIDALLLYLHLMFTARVQETASVYAKDSYLRKGLGFGEKRLKRAKAFLHKANLIEYKQSRDSSGLFEEKYIIVKISDKLPVGSSTTPAVNRTSGQEEQMLSKKPKCFPKKKTSPSLTRGREETAEELIARLRKEGLVKESPAEKYQRELKERYG
jgi:hypothetical protein